LIGFVYLYNYIQSSNPQTPTNTLDTQQQYEQQQQQQQHDQQQQGKKSGSHFKGDDVYFGMIKDENEIVKREKGYRDFSFNVLVSDRIGYYRDVPDTRSRL